MASKQVKITTPKKSLYFSVYSHIKEHNCLPQRMKKQNLNYYVQRLVNAELIRKKGYGVWEILKDVNELELKKEVKTFTCVTTTSASKQFSKKHQVLRYHSLQFRLQLPYFEQWHRRHIFLAKKQIPFNTLQGNKHRIVKKGVIFHLCKESIIFYCPEQINFYAYDSETLRKTAFRWAKSQVITISNVLGVDLKRQGRWHLELTRGEIEETNNELAQGYQDNQEKLEVYQNDELWLTADKSLRTNNLELKSAKKHLQDTDAVIPFFNDLRDSPTTISKTKEELEDHIKGLQQQLKEVLELVQSQQLVITDLKTKSVNMDRFKY